MDIPALMANFIMATLIHITPRKKTIETHNKKAIKNEFHGLDDLNSVSNGKNINEQFAKGKLNLTCSTASASGHSEFPEQYNHEFYEPTLHNKIRSSLFVTVQKLRKFGKINVQLTSFIFKSLTYGK